MAGAEATPADLAAGVFDDDDEQQQQEAKEPRACIVCGGSMEGRHPAARYCGDKCKEAASKARRAGDTRPVTIGKPGGKVPLGMILWGSLGYAAQMRLGEPIGTPVGRVMQFQAPDAGPRLERLGAKIGKALPFTSRLSKGSELASDLAHLIMPPLITMAIASGTIPRQVAEPIFIGIMRPLIADAMSQSQQAVETMAAMSEAEAEVIDTTRQFLDAIFGGPDREAP